MNTMSAHVVDNAAARALYIARATARNRAITAAGFAPSAYSDGFAIAPERSDAPAFQKAYDLAKRMNDLGTEFGIVVHFYTSGHIVFSGLVVSTGGQLNSIETLEPKVDCPEIFETVSINAFADEAEVAMIYYEIQDALSLSQRQKS